MRVGRVFYFDASHHLPDYRGKCERVHGHTYRLEIVVEGEQKEGGMVIDFNELKEIVVREVWDKLDHTDLNEIMENPTAENIADWIFDRLKKKIPLCCVRLWEGEGKWVERSV